MAQVVAGLGLHHSLSHMSPLPVQVVTVTTDGDWPQLSSSLLPSSPKAGTAAARLSLHYGPSQAYHSCGWPWLASAHITGPIKRLQTQHIQPEPTQRLYNLQTQQTALAGTRAPPKQLPLYQPLHNSLTIVARAHPHSQLASRSTPPNNMPAAISAQLQ